MKLEVITNSENETMLVAEKLAKTIKAPCVISLVGDLGAGKTTFTKGFAKGLGVKDIVTSPTFTLFNEYLDQPTKLYHFDMYRISGDEEIKELGFEEYFDLKKLDGITLVEWAENTPEIMPKKYSKITFEKLDDEKRKIIIEL